MKRDKVFNMGLSLLIVVGLIAILFAFVQWSAAQTATPGADEWSAPPDSQPEASINQPQADLPDLEMSEFSMSPVRPRVNEPVTISLHVVNTGTASAPGARVWLYVDPPVQPPITTTYQNTREVAYGISMPPGASILIDFMNYTFSTAGCQHVLYAWVDPLGRVAESDETNNLRAINLCVDPEAPTVPGADAFEPDDTCSSSAPSLATDGTPQVHSFVPAADVDYVRFQATQGVTYTVTAAGTGRDADPNLELSDSCNFVPPFGTTARAQFVAPNSGMYYLKLSNAKINPDPNQTTYQLSVLAEGQPITGDQPSLVSLAPTSGLNDRNTNVVLSGTQFAFPTMVEACRYQNSVCNAACTQFLNVTWMSTQKLYGVIPANLDPGAYCVQATNPGGKKSSLPNVFIALPAAPDPREVLPARGYADAPTDLHVYGFNFAEGISLTMGTMGLENIKVLNGTHLLATLPKGLSPGPYTLTASYLVSGSGQLINAFAVLEAQPSLEDLYAQSGELWCDPLTPRVGEPMSLGVVVHRRPVTPTVTLADLPVRFAVNGVTIGDVVIPLLASDSQVSTGRVYYTPTATGDYVVTALIDPNQTVAESTRANNVVTRTIPVTVAASDRLAPHVDSLTINSGARQIVTTTQVVLSTDATDLPNPGGSGVAEVRYIELEYNQGARLWVPVRDSRWLNYTLNHTNYPWTLTPVGGIHYIQAWARDAAGNVSRYPYQASVNYLPPTERVGRDQVRIYRQRLAAGETLLVTLSPTSGDADLYIWPPDWQSGRPPWVSNQDGLTVDQVSFTAPVSGVYQIEVYGYVSSDYQLTFATSMIAADAGRLSPASPTGRHWPNVAPSVPVTSEPPRDIPAAATDIPTLLAPPNGTVTTTQAITFAWQAGTGDLPTGYNLRLDGAVITTTATTSSTILSVGVHTWTVRAYNADGYSDWAASWTVTVTGTAPGVPILVSPPNGTVTTTQTVVLTWQADAGGTPTGYNVNVDEAVITATGTTSTTLLPEGVHTWTVRAYNATGYSAWAAPWTVEVRRYRICLPLVLRGTN